MVFLGDQSGFFDQKFTRRMPQAHKKTRATADSRSRNQLLDWLSVVDAEPTGLRPFRSKPMMMAQEQQLSLH